jgi:SAM-dependent methyltransferase
MNLTLLRGSIEFWDRFAHWYEKWLNRGTYHRAIIKAVSEMVEPGWRVLDIGAGTGVLSIPMASLGCTVTAIEPSEGMGELFSAKLSSLHVDTVSIAGIRWEDFQMEEEGRYDLILACNSLHLTQGGIAVGIKKAFSLGGAYVSLITEINQDIFIDFKTVDSLQDTYNFLSIRKYRVDSSFFFESMHEVERLQEFLNREIQVTMEDGRPVQRDSTDIAAVWWEKKSGL